MRLLESMKEKLSERKKTHLLLLLRLEGEFCRDGVSQFHHKAVGGQVQLKAAKQDSVCGCLVIKRQKR